MDEKTAHLRDLFVSATGEETVTERQEESRGSLAGGGESEDRLRELVATMRDRYGFDTDLDDAALVVVARRFHEGDDDGDVAADLGVDPAEVFRARTDLHLVSDADREAPFDRSRLRALLTAGESVAAAAADLDADPAVVERPRRVLAADDRARRTGQRFRDEFAELLTDADLSTRLVRDAREDGLREATEDIETDVSF
jgi:hypothetical protein